MKTKSIAKLQKKTHFSNVPKHLIALPEPSVLDYKGLTKNLVHWYKDGHRPLPWRQSRDPYKIWISEVMLQQTTVTAVVPFFERFITLFPDVKTLAQAPLEQVLQAWAGLGYYSRARNLHKAAQILQNGFPQSYQQLIELSGFGPYTSRAISSLAFGEQVGVLDGNVIRVLTRLIGHQSEWWKTSVKENLQKISDQIAYTDDPYYTNQALMELGATICTPTNPSCSECPWSSRCISFKKNLQASIPMKKPRRENEIWVWNLSLVKDKKKFLMIKEASSPILKNQWMFPGTFKKSSKKPSEFLFKHQITHHEIYVCLNKKIAENFEPSISKHKSRLKTVTTAKSKNSQSPIEKQDIQKLNPDSIWVAIDEISQLNPSSLLTKTLKSLGH